MNSRQFAHWIDIGNMIRDSITELLCLFGRCLGSKSGGISVQQPCTNELNGHQKTTKKLTLDENFTICHFLVSDQTIDEIDTSIQMQRCKPFRKDSKRKEKTARRVSRCTVLLITLSRKFQTRVRTAPRGDFEISRTISFASNNKLAEMQTPNLPASFQAQAIQSQQSSDSTNSVDSSKYKTAICRAFVRGSCQFASWSVEGYRPAVLISLYTHSPKISQHLFAWPS